MKYKTTLAHRNRSKAWALANPLRVKLNNKKYRKNNQQKLKLYESTRSKNRIRFKGKYIRLKQNPKTGICSKCGKSVYKGEIKKTHMHHTKYDKRNPLKYTIELCVSCHVKEHYKESD